MLPNIETPITDLQKQTVTQLKTTLTAQMTRRDLLILANGSEKIISAPARVYRKDGQIESQSETIKDVETNAVIFTKSITWTYYPTGEVDIITIIETNAKGVHRKVIKHFKDGKPPEVENDL